MPANPVESESLVRELVLTRLYDAPRKLLF
jgi:hypothetical protein